MIVGYARTSTIDQVAGFESQVAELQQAKAEKLFCEQISALSERRALNDALEFVREGDVLVVTRLDRLARSVSHFCQIVEQCRFANSQSIAGYRHTDRSPYDQLARIDCCL